MLQLTIGGSVPVIVPETAAAAELRIVPLAQHFIDPHGHAVGEVQASGFAEHGNPDTGIRVFEQELFRKAGGFLSKNQIGAVRIGNIGMSVAGFGGKIEEGPRIFCEKVGQTVIEGDVQQMPVIQSRPFQLPVVNGETHGAHQMKPCTGGGTGPGDIAGVLGDFRLYKNDIEGRQAIDSFSVSRNLPVMGNRQKKLIKFQKGGTLMNAGSVMRYLILYRRLYCFMKSTMNVVKGVGLGMLAGAAVVMVGERVAQTNKKQLKKNAGKAVKAMGDVLDGVQYMFH